MKALKRKHDRGSPWRAPLPKGASGEKPCGVRVFTLHPLSISSRRLSTPSGIPRDLIAKFRAVCSTESYAFAMSRYATWMNVEQSGDSIIFCLILSFDISYTHLVM